MSESHAKKRMTPAFHRQATVWRSHAAQVPSTAFAPRKRMSQSQKAASVRDWIAQYERFWDDHLQRLQKHLSKRSER